MAVPGAAHVSEPAESRSRIRSWHPSSDVAGAMPEENLAGDFCCFFIVKEVETKKKNHPPAASRALLSCAPRDSSGVCSPRAGGGCPR